MRNSNPTITERYVAIGQEIGEERGLSEGEMVGVAIGTIMTARDLGASDTYIVERLIDTLGISEQDAVRYVSERSEKHHALPPNVRVLRASDRKADA